MKQLSPNIKSSEFNQQVKLYTMPKYVLAHRILLIVSYSIKDCTVATMFYLMD